MNKDKTGFSFCSEKEKYEEAISNFKKIIEKYPNDFKSYINLGAAYALTFNYKDAITAFEKAIEINPSFAEAYNELGIVYATEEKYSQAITAFEKAIEIDPDFLLARNNLDKAIKDKDLSNKDTITIYKH